MRPLLSRRRGRHALICAIQHQRISFVSFSPCNPGWLQEGTSYHADGREEVDVKQPLPLLHFHITPNPLHWFQDAMVDNQPIQPSKLLVGHLCSLCAQRQVREIAGQNLDLRRWVLGCKVLEGGLRACYREDLVGLAEEVV